MIACFKSQGWEENQMETPRHQDRMLHWGYNGESAWTAKVIYFLMLFHYKDLEGYHMLLPH